MTSEYSDSSNFFMGPRCFKLKASSLNKKGKEQVSAEVQSMRNAGSIWSDIDAEIPVFLATFRRWSKSDMSPASQTHRQTHPRRPTLLSLEEEAVVLANAQIQRSQHLAVTEESTRQAISDATNQRIPNAQNSYISKFWRKHKWPNRKAQRRTINEVRPTIKQETADFQADVTRYANDNNIPKSRIYVMDEVGIWSGSVSPRTYVDPATQDNGVVSEGQNRRDTGIVALSASGSVESTFLQHIPQRTRKRAGRTEIVQKGVSGVGLQQMETWAEVFGTARGVNESILLLDRLQAHKNPRIHQILQTHHVKPFLFPGQASKFISPCDNSFFSSMKARIRRMDTSTTEKKRVAFITLCNQFDPLIVQHFWSHCGWTFQEED
jgi:hypothetical protein